MRARNRVWCSSGTEHSNVDEAGEARRLESDLQRTQQALQSCKSQLHDAQAAKAEAERKAALAQTAGRPEDDAVHMKVRSSLAPACVLSTVAQACAYARELCLMTPVCIPSEPGGPTAAHGGTKDVMIARACGRPSIAWILMSACRKQVSRFSQMGAGGASRSKAGRSASNGPVPVTCSHVNCGCTA